jgi:Zn-dependent peptidase ImmA (M78 family)
MCLNGDMAARPVPLTGGVLEWAMKDVGVSSAELAAAVGVPEAAIQAWTTEDDRPTTTQFRRLVKRLHRPESFFFLPEPPNTEPVSVAYRTHVGEGDGQPGAESVEALRLAERVQRITAWVRARTHIDARDVPQLAESQNPELAARILRRWLGWQLTDQVSPVTESNAARAMRQRLQDFGLLVLHLSLDEDAVRGFSLPHAGTPVIVVNTKDSYRARLFLYVHELAHLSIQDESVCLTRQNKGTERWCNRVAASVLLPAEEFRQYVQRRFGSRLVSTTAEVGSLSNYFNVSLRAIAIRLIDLDLSVASLYETVDREAFHGKRKGGRYNPDRVQTKPRVRLQQYGRGYVNMLTDAEEAGVLARPQVLELLRLSTSELTSIREMSASGVEG